MLSIERSRRFAPRSADTAEVKRSGPLTLSAPGTWCALYPYTQGGLREHVNNKVYHYCLRSMVLVSCPRANLHTSTLLPKSLRNMKPTGTFSPTTWHWSVRA